MEKKMKLGLNELLELLSEIDVDLDSSSKKTIPASANILEIEEIFSFINEQKELLEQQEVGFEASPERALELLIPKIEINPKTLGDSEVLQRVIKKIKKATPSATITSLNDVIKQTSSGQISKRGLRSSLEGLGVLCGLKKLFNDFDSTSTGFINESFLALFFEDGKVIPSAKANNANLVADIMVNGVPNVSLKTRADSVIGGSAFNLCNNIKKYNEVQYYFFRKNTQGAEVAGFELFYTSLGLESLAKIKLVAKDREDEERLNELGLNTVYDYYNLIDRENLWNNKSLKLEEEDLDQETDLRLPKPKFTITLDDLGLKSQGEVQFSVEQLYESIKQQIAASQQQIVAIHRNLQVITQILPMYLLDTEVKKASHKEKMLESVFQVEQIVSSELKE